MKVFDKILPKVVPKVLGGILRPGTFFGSGITVPLDNLIAWYKGTISEDGSELLASSGNHSGQVKGTSVAGDGTGYGTLSETVTLVGDFKISYKIIPTIIADPNTNIILGQDNSSKDMFKSTLEGYLECNIDGNWYNGGINTILTLGENSVEFERVSDTLYIRNGTNETTLTSVSTASIVLNYVLMFGVVYKATAKAYNLKATDSTGLKLDLAMICLDSTTEYSATEGLPDCVWSGFTGDPIVEHTDGTGSNRANEDGYSEDGSNVRYPLYHSSGTTDYPGPIAADMSFTNMPCLLGDGTGHVAITGLLTTDTISVASGSDTPTCTTNGQLDIASGESVYYLTITRASSVWAHYPCENGHPTHNADITMLEDVVGGNHGTATGFTGTCWGERDTGDFALAKGFSVDRVAGYGYSPINPLTGLLQGGGTPTYKKNQFDTALALPASVKGALGPETQALTSYTGEAEITRLVDQVYNIDSKEFVGIKGAVLYDTAQDAAAIVKITNILGDPT